MTPEPQKAPPPHRSDRFASSFVWVTWLLMVAIAVAVWFHFARNVPYSEDWFLVPPLTGNEPHLFHWLWELHHDHRTPLPRLMLLVILKLASGDFRAAAFCNILLLALISAAFIRAVRSLRGGWTRSSDVFFPLAFLHLGNVENMLWPWQMTFVISVVLICGYLLALASQEGLLTRHTAVAAGVCLVLLPLTGATGLLFVPVLAIWQVILAFRSASDGTATRAVRFVLIGTAGLAAVITGLYFIAYERQTTGGTRITWTLSLWAGAQSLALAFGPIVKSLSLIVVSLAFLIVLDTSVVTAVAVKRDWNGRSRLVGLYLLLISGVLAAFALGRGRAELIWGFYGGWPLRYGLLMVPVFCAAYLIVEGYGTARARNAIQYGMAAILFGALPLNTACGAEWVEQYTDRLDEVLRDLYAGLPSSVLGERHYASLFMPGDQPARLFAMLRQAGIPPYANRAVAKASPAPGALSRVTPQPAVTEEIQYRLPGAGEVFLLWGVNGWQILPGLISVGNTETYGNLMRTKMISDGDRFTAKIQVPQNVEVDYAFTVTRRRDGRPVVLGFDSAAEYHFKAAAKSLHKVDTKLKLTEEDAPVYIGGGPIVKKEIRYHQPDAREVVIVWGVNDWHTIPSDKRAPGTQIKFNLMRMTMNRQDGVFAAKLNAPSGTLIKYYFLVTKKRGLLERLLGPALINKDARRQSRSLLNPRDWLLQSAASLMKPVFALDAQPVYLSDGDSRYSAAANGDRVIDVMSAHSISENVWPVIWKPAYYLLGLGCFLIAWALHFAVMYGYEKFRIQESLANIIRSLGASKSL